MRIFLLLGLLFALPAGAQTPPLALSTAEPGNLFGLGAAAVVTVQAAAGPVAWRLLDFDRKQVSAGNAELAAGRATVNLGTLGQGYYEFLAKAGEAEARLTLGVVTDHSGQEPPETRLNVDAAAAWLCQTAQLEPLAKMLRRAGMGWVRERFSWGATEPAPEQVDWRQYDLVARAYTAQGVRVYQIWHDSPGWSHGPGETRNPRDLRDVYRYTKRLAEHYRGQVRAWEVWNEPDIGFWPDLSDTYAGLAKAAYLGFKAGDPDLPVLLGSFCRGLCDFDAGVLEAGTGAYFDIFNWHIYAPPEAYAGALKGYLDLLGQHGCADRPVWLTEAGIRLEGTEPGGELNPADERRQAEFVPKSFAASLAAGTDRHFFFVCPYYLENGVQFGALRRDLSVRPGFVAIAAAVDLLGEARHLGRYLLPASPGVTVQAFATGRGTALVAWADKAQTVTLDVDAAEVTLADAIGRRHTQAAPGGKLALSVGPAPWYVLGAGAGLTARLGGPVRPPGKLPVNRPCPVIVRGQAAEGKVDKATDSYLIGLEPLKYSVEAYNFGAGPVSGEVSLQVPSGWQVTPAAVPVALPRQGRRVAEFTLTPGKMTGDVLKVTVTPRFGQFTVAPSVSHFRYDLNRVPPAAALDLGLNDPARWESNISGNGTMTTSAADGAVHFAAKFTAPGDRWCYPRVTFDPPRDFSAYAGLSFEYRCGPADKLTVRPQLYEAGGSGYLPGPLAGVGEWTRVSVRWSDLNWGPFSPPDPDGKFDPRAVKSLMVGLNTKEDNVWLEVRNVQLVRWE